MQNGSFNITYQKEELLVEQTKDVNDEFYYKISFPNKEIIDIYVTPAAEGIAPTWVEGKGEHTTRAREIGDLIENYEN